MPKNKSELLRQIINGHKAVFGGSFDAGVSMTVSPVIIQRTEEKLRQMYAFLGLITSTPTEDSYGEILSLTDAISIGQRTKTATYNDFRRPVDVGGFSGRQFKVEELELDVKILWNTITQWGMQSNDVFNLYRAHILRSRAASRLRIGFYGQSENLAVNSNLATYPLMEDVAKGWFQYMIEHRPEAVFGITPVATNIDPKGYTINPINVGDGGDFSSMAQLVDYLKTTLIERIYRGDTGIRAICGDSLITSDISKLISNAGNTPIERTATEALMSISTIAKMPAIVPDEMPARGLIITNPANLEYIYQIQSVERMIENSHEQKGIVDYLYQKVDFVIKAIEGCAMVHPDAIRFKDEQTGAWVAATDTWAINPVA